MTRPASRGRVGREGTLQYGSIDSGSIESSAEAATSEPNLLKVIYAPRQYGKKRPQNILFNENLIMRSSMKRTHN